MKNSQKGSVVLWIIIVIVVIGLGVYFYNKTRVQELGDTIQAELVQSNSKVGDVVRGMKIVSIQDTKVEFSGKTTVSGRYELSDLDGLNYFDLDESSAEKLPAFKNVKVGGGFNVSDGGKELDFKKGGQATVVIDNFTLYYSGMHILNSAKIISVVENKPLNLLREYSNPKYKISFEIPSSFVAEENDGDGSPSSAVGWIRIYCIESKVCGLQSMDLYIYNVTATGNPNAYKIIKHGQYRYEIFNPQQDPQFVPIPKELADKIISTFVFSE